MHLRFVLSEKKKKKGCIFNLMQAINYDVKLFSFSFFLSFFSTKDDIYQKNKNKKENPKKSDRIAIPNNYETRTCTKYTIMYNSKG